MSGEVSASTMVGFAIIQHQRDLVKEGKSFRDAAHEMAQDAKKTEMAYEKIDDSAREWDKAMKWVDAAESGYEISNTEIKPPEGPKLPEFTKQSAFDEGRNWVGARLAEHDKVDRQIEGMLDRIREGAKDLGAKTTKMIEQDAKLVKDTEKDAGIALIRIA